MAEIIWALDPTRKPEDSIALVKQMKFWKKHLDCNVRPVSIFYKSIFNWPSELAFPEKEVLQMAAQKSVEQHIKKARATDFLPPEILFAPTLSTRKMASELAQYAKQKRAILIFANTRARKGWNPFRLGGFAETLITSAKVPVVLLNSKTRSSEKISRILMPTDFTSESKNALLNLEPWAKNLNAKVTLYNQVESLNIYSAEPYQGWGPGTYSVKPAMKATEEMRNLKAQIWLRRLQKKDIESSAIIEWEKKDLATSIVNVAKKNKVDLIALSSHRGAVSQSLLGSVARDVLVQSHCPVLVFYRPKPYRKNIQRHSQRRSVVIPTKEIHLES